MSVGRRIAEIWEALIRKDRRVIQVYVADPNPEVKEVAERAADACSDKLPVYSEAEHDPKI